MILVTDLSKIEKGFSRSIVTIGNFDGLHLGHQELIKRIIRRAKETSSVSMVVTFRPHPLKILAPEKCPPLISIYEEKIGLFEKLGIDVLVKIPFTLDFSAMEPREFVKNVLCELLGAKEIFVGYNYRFGKGRKGDIRMLKALGEELGFVVREIDQVSLDGEVISSTCGKTPWQTLCTQRDRRQRRREGPGSRGPHREHSSEACDRPQQRGLRRGSFCPGQILQRHSEYRRASNFRYKVPGHRSAYLRF
jgi:cytidyltransferase-like protein